MAKTTPSGQNVLKVKLKDLVNAQKAMKALGARALTGKVSFIVGKALKQAQGEVETFMDANMKLLQELGGTPSPLGGLELDSKHENYDEAWQKLDAHSRSALGVEVELTGVITVTYDELMEAMSLPKGKCPECGTVTKYSDEEKAKKSIEPYILAALDWLIVE